MRSESQYYFTRLDVIYIYIYIYNGVLGCKGITQDKRFPAMDSF